MNRKERNAKNHCGNSGSQIITLISISQLEKIINESQEESEGYSMTESIVGGIAVVAFIVFLSASNAIFEMRKLERERKARELELIKQQEEWLMVQKGIAMERATFTKMAQATLAKGPCKEIV